MRDAGLKQRERMALRSRAQSLSAREIAPIPPMRNPQRRMAARKCLKTFCEHYFPQRFKLAWSSYHLEVIERLQKILVQGGGKLALAMPRGSGKTTLIETAIIWAVLFGHCRFIVAIGANHGEAKKIINNIKAALSANKELLADFPESIYPFHKLKGSALLARGQLYLGELTSIEWKPDMVVFPRIPGSPACGAIIVSVGIHGAIRGKNRTMPDGSIARPDAIILDDVSTKKDAASKVGTEKIVGIINEDVSGLVGPADEMAMFMACTVIREGDVATYYLDRVNRPLWNGLRYKMVETMPERMDLWEKYAEIRWNDPVAATIFYKTNRTEMKKGAVVAWEANYNSPETLDALQFAMNKWCDNEASFMSEYQNDPLRPDAGAVVVPEKTIRSRLNGFDKRTVPMEASTLTAFIDVHDDLLYYAVTAWASDFTGYVIDYGTWPKQTRKKFAKGDKGLYTMGGDAERKDGVIQAGIVSLLKELTATVWDVEGDSDGAEHRTIDKILVDGGYKPGIVENAIRLAFGRSNAAFPSRGKAVRASQLPMADWKPKPGERKGDRWIIGRPPGRGITVTFDTNYWKVQLHDAFRIAPGNRGGLTLWGRDPERHRMFSEHLNGESAKLVESDGKAVYEWIDTPRDNHLFDCMVGCMVAASLVGIKTLEEQAARPTRRRRQVL